ncbi:hypothetical protein N8T08_004624 [Aspergillus melleus]|uniref:Uncharacterized protein n=1 Tax=Aspergillus melleus TaxID=138277 RepID=A0ACC3B4C3_9EURO|nr:hypothetical protein N8T08_004624 [Aspergillus melleus]
MLENWQNVVNIAFSPYLIERGVRYVFVAQAETTSGPTASGPNVFDRNVSNNCFRNAIVDEPLKKPLVGSSFSGGRGSQSVGTTLLASRWSNSYLEITLIAILIHAAPLCDEGHVPHSDRTPSQPILCDRHVAQATPTRFLLTDRAGSTWKASPSTSPRSIAYTTNNVGLASSTTTPNATNDHVGKRQESEGWWLTRPGKQGLSRSWDPSDDEGGEELTKWLCL